MRNCIRLTACGSLLVVVTWMLSGSASSQQDAAAKNEPAPAARRPYCEDWPEPAFALFITGRQHGYIEPCGCTGLNYQKGGLARRETLYRELVGRGWNVVPVDVGNQVRRFGPQAAIKFQTTMSALKNMDYAAVGLGPDDLRLDSGELITEVVDGTPLVCSNVTIADFPISDGYKIVQAGKHKIGITAILGAQEQRGIRSTDIQFSTPEQGIARAHAAFVRARCNLMVLLSHASTEETLRIAKKKVAEDFHVIITAGGADEPALMPQRIEGTRSFLIQTGKKGMYVGVLAVYPDAADPIRYERVPLDSRFKDSEKMLKALATYQQRLKDLYERDWTQLVLQPVKHPSGHEFVGSAACQDCHETAFDVWQASPHHDATHSIAFPTERSSIPRNFDPECLSCHVTGWDPQGYFPYVSGYEDYAKSKHLHGNGCENCHGPGSAHVAAENGEVDLSDTAITQLRAAMRLTLSDARDHCLKCHDLDNDPNFQEEGVFEEYWERIEHYE